MITLPPEMTRCLAHDNKPRAFWDCAETCARAVQIRHDARPSENVALNFCAFHTQRPMFVPLDGFPQDVEEITTTPAPTCNYPKCTCPFDAPADPNWCARGYPKAGAANTQPENIATGSRKFGQVIEGRASSHLSNQFFEE